MKAFRFYAPEQTLMMPPRLEDWLPEGHLAHFIEELTAELDLSEFYAAYEEDGRGLAAYHPLLMVRLLFYGYATGYYSSRRLERATYEDVAVRYLSADQHPDHTRIAEFRRRHIDALPGLFRQIVRLCDRAGLTRLERVALDGTKVKANASRFKARKYEQMQEDEKRLAEEIAKWMEEADRVDAAEDAAYGKHRRGDELPPALATKERRLELIRRLKAELEQEAKEKAEKQRVEAERHLEERRQEEQRRGRRFGGRQPQVPDPQKATPKPTAQRSLTDPQSRIMKDKSSNSFQQAYNAQVAVDGERQIIVATAVTNQEYDREQLVPLVLAIEQNLEGKPAVVLADSGYWSPDAMDSAVLQGIDIYVPPEGEEKVEQRGQASRWARNQQALDGMREKMKTAAARTLYRARQGIVEPVFGQVKQARGFRQFLLRGLRKVGGEWSLVCAAFDARKLFDAGGMALLHAGKA